MRTGLTIVRYRRLAHVTPAPQVLADSDVSAPIWWVAFAITLAICGFHDRVESICTPRIRICPFGGTFAAPILTGSSILNFLGVFVRWMSSYFVGSNLAPCRRAHCSQISCMAPSRLQFSFVLLPYVNRLTSSTNPVDVIFCAGDWHASSRLALKNRNRIGDRTDP